MTELAPNHKIGLSLSSPVMIASGFCGYGDAYHRLLDLSSFGAIVTGPITLRPQRGQPQPRLVETKAGFILNTGQQNPGVKKVLRQYGKIWPKLGVPIMAHLPATDPDDLMRTARALSGVQTPHGESVIAAIELELPRQAAIQDVARWVRAVHAGSELPLLVIPLNAHPEIAETAVKENADALVVGVSVSGTAFTPHTKKEVIGNLYGPALHSLTLHYLKTISDFDVPLVAVGGIHTIADAGAFFDAGATAVQIDSLLFVNPGAAEAIAYEFRTV